MSEFDILADAVSLAKQSRMNAAKSQWLKLSIEFRIKVLTFLQQILQIPWNDQDTYHLNSKYGKFILNTQTLLEWITYIPQLST